jgi:hypothetical protein
MGTLSLFAFVLSLYMMDEDSTAITTYTTCFSLYTFFYMICVIIALHNNLRKREYSRHNRVLKLQWFLLLSGTLVNAELLMNFPQRESQYIQIGEFLTLFFISGTMFLVTRGKKLAKKMTGSDYLTNH